MHAFAAESRLVRALFCAALVAAAPSVATAQQSVWEPQVEASAIDEVPWAGVAGSAVFDVEDAFVFADPQRGPRLDPDAEAVAVKLDRDRLASVSGAPGPSQGRVALAFDGFVSLSPDGLTYASVELARSDAANARYASSDWTPARVAMTDAR